MPSLLYLGTQLVGHLSRGGGIGEGISGRHQHPGRARARGPSPASGGDGRADYLVLYNGGSVRAWLNQGGNTGQS
ncbi:hypothetical protein OHA25_22965 [Nonomuraea sp. NBC_00507]|uniref:hypothetical protein n=1 Tax=Nonomuraea sp. NBC_00507 TaxID=2976002 RepID=UPI002E17069F